MATPFNTSSIPHHTHLKNKGLQTPHYTASSAKIHDTGQPHEPQSSPHTQTGSYNPLFAVVPQRHSFNPRSHVGSDVILTIKMHVLVCQSTLPRGERLTAAKLAAGAIEFQSTLPRGERHELSNTSLLMLVFQSTLPRGERHMVLVDVGRGKQFQSTLPRGERRSIVQV